MSCVQDCTDCIPSYCDRFTCKRNGYQVLEYRIGTIDSSGIFSGFFLDHGSNTNGASISVSNLDPFFINNAQRGTFRVDAGYYKIVIWFNTTMTGSAYIKFNFIPSVSPPIVKFFPLQNTPIAGNYYNVYEFVLYSPQTQDIQFVPEVSGRSMNRNDFVQFRPYVESQPTIMLSIASMPTELNAGPQLGVSNFNMYTTEKKNILPATPTAVRFCPSQTHMVLSGERMIRIEVLLNVQIGNSTPFAFTETLTVKYNGVLLKNPVPLLVSSVIIANSGRQSMSYVGEFCVSSITETITIEYPSGNISNLIILPSDIIIQDITETNCLCETTGCYSFGYMNTNYEVENKSGIVQSHFSNNRVDTNSWTTSFENVNLFEPSLVDKQNTVFLRSDTYYKIILQYTQSDVEMSYIKYIFSGLKTGTTKICRFTSTLGFNADEIIFYSDCSDYYTLTLEYDSTQELFPSIAPYTDVVGRIQVYISQIPTNIMYNSIYGVSQQYKIYKVNPIVTTGCTTLPIEEIVSTFDFLPMDNVRVEIILEIESDIDTELTIVTLNNEFQSSKPVLSGTSCINFISAVKLATIDFELSGYCVNIKGGYILIQKDFGTQECEGGFAVTNFIITPSYQSTVGNIKTHRSFFVAMTTNSCDIAVSNPDPFLTEIKTLRLNAISLKKGYYKIINAFKVSSPITEGTTFRYIFRPDNLDDIIYPFVFNIGSDQNTQEIILYVCKDTTIQVDIETPTTVLLERGDESFPANDAIRALEFTIASIPTLFNLNRPWGVNKDYALYCIIPEQVTNGFCPCYTFGLHLIDSCGEFKNTIRVEIMVRVRVGMDLSVLNYTTIKALFSGVEIQSRVLGVNCIATDGAETVLNFVSEVAVSNYEPIFNLLIPSHSVTLEIIEGYIIIQ